MVPKQFKVGKTKQIEQQIKDTKEWLGEKTDSKTIQWLINYGYNKLFK